jgi:pSer/pThr/pTyr-binding forkhead associated (FHA) protein
MDVQLKVVQGKSRGHSLRFAPGEFVIGRGPECHVRPNSEWISRQHFLLRVRGDGVSIRDLGSTNGTLVNGSLVVGERPMQSGDLLQLGSLVLQLVVGHQATLSDQEIAGRLDTAVFEGGRTIVGLPILEPPHDH